jgi:hypothetical protein
MAIPLGEFAAYLVPGLKTLNKDELESLPNAVSLINFESINLKGAVEDYIKFWRLYEKVDILTRGIQEEESNSNDKRMQWGRMLLYFHGENMLSGSDVFSDLSQSNYGLIEDIEKDFVKQEHLIREYHKTVGSGIDLEAILSDPSIWDMSKKFPIAEGLLSVVEKSNIGTFIRKASKAAGIPAEIGLLSEIIKDIYGMEISEDEGYKIMEKLREKFPKGNPFEEYKSKYISGLWIYRGPNKNDMIIRDLVWNSVPRLIEENGYLSLEYFLDSSTESKLKGRNMGELHTALEEKMKQEEYVELFQTIEGDIYYLQKDSLGKAREFIENFIVQYTMTDKQKVKLQSQEQEQSLTNLVHSWKSGDYTNIQKIVSELENSGFDHWSLKLFMASSYVGGIIKSEPNREIKRRLRPQLQNAMDEYMKSFDMGRNIPQFLYQIADNDIQSLRRFAARAQSAWGVNDSDVVYIRQRANILESELRHPGFFEQKIISMTNLVSRDKFMKIVNKAIQEYK